MLETLPNIRHDLERTATHLEDLSLALAGHLVYASHRSSVRDGAGIVSNIEAIDSTVATLRNAAARIAPDRA